jgi:RHS repeat-associated protein
LTKYIPPISRQFNSFTIGKEFNAQPLFDAPLQGRSFHSYEYRFAFNGKEKIDEINGAGNDLDFGARVYDARLGRFLSIDPDAHVYPFMSTFCFAANSPINLIDKSGRGPGPSPFNFQNNGNKFYSAGYVSTSDRKFNNAGMSIVYGSGGLLTGLLEFGVNTSEANEQVKNGTYNGAIMGRDLGQNTWEIMNGTMPYVFGGELLGKSLEIFGHVSTSYDVISETNSKATRAERLTDLTILVAQWELQGTRNDPGSTGNSQFNIQKDDFESAEQASEVFNNMYNMIDAAYKIFDLTKNDDFNLVQVNYT